MAKFNPIIFEDEFFIVLDKPSGLLVYAPNYSKEEETVIDLVKDRITFPKNDNRPGIVHRLDRDTSGLLLVAKNEKAATSLKALFKNRQIEKYYTTLVWGEVTPKEGFIEIPLGRGSKDRLRIVPDKDGKSALTEYRVLRYYKNSGMTLVEVRLHTGRTHQIRVHMSAIGYPIVGDNKYSQRKSALGRHFLHAGKLAFKHPVSRQDVKFESKLPLELETFLKSLS